MIRLILSMVYTTNSAMCITPKIPSLATSTILQLANHLLLTALLLRSFWSVLNSTYVRTPKSWKAWRRRDCLPSPLNRVKTVLVRSRPSSTWNAVRWHRRVWKKCSTRLSRPSSSPSLRLPPPRRPVEDVVAWSCNNIIPFFLLELV